LLEQACFYIRALPVSNLFFSENDIELEDDNYDLDPKLAAQLFSQNNTRIMFTMQSFTS